MAVPKLEQKVKPVLTIEEIQSLYAACNKEYSKQPIVRDKAYKELNSTMFFESYGDRCHGIVEFKHINLEKSIMRA